MAITYDSARTGLAHDEDESRLVALENQIVTLTNKVATLEAQQPIFKYTVCKLEDNNGSNVTYSTQEIPIVQLYSNNPDIYVSGGYIKSTKAQKIMVLFTGTFYHPSDPAEIWVTLRDGTKRLATALDSRSLWITLNFTTIVDVTTSSNLNIFIHDSSIQVHNSGVGNPLRVSEIIIIPVSS